MAKSLSGDLRARLIKAVDSGMSCRAAADRFGVSPASAVRWVRTWRDTGAKTAKQQGGDRRSARIEAYHDVIFEAIKAKIDISLVELTELLRRKHRVAFAPSTLWRFLDRHAMTVKKNSARQRAGQARRRGAAQRLARHSA
jgi:transposase